MNGIRTGFAVLLLLLGFPLQANAFVPPEFHGDVLDDAEVLSPAEEAMLAGYIRRLREEAGVWAAVYTARDLDGTTLEEAANRTFRAWGLGEETKNNGLLVLIVPSARVVRIEVGYGLEGLFTDAYCSQLIVQVYQPAFRSGKFAEGLAQGFQRMADEKLGRRVYLGGMPVEVEQTPAVTRFATVFSLNLIPGFVLAGIAAWGRSRGRSRGVGEMVEPLLIFGTLGAFLALITSSPGGTRELYEMLLLANGVIVGVFFVYFLIQSRRYLFASSYRRFLAEERLIRIRRRSDEERMIFGRWFEPARVSVSQGGTRAGAQGGSSSSSGFRSSSGGGSSGGGGASGRW